MDADDRLALVDDLARYGCRVHQPDEPRMMTRDPQSPMQPMHWRWVDLDRLLKRLGAEIVLEPGGERRTLRLANPGLPFGTTPTFWGSIQYILPGEIASAHRHAPHAIRFIMQGNGATTTVDGERYPMRQGDLVLTPAGAWHDHQHEGDAPMIWLDGLDISLVKAMHAMFFEPYPENRQLLSQGHDASLRRYGSGIMRPTRGLPVSRVSPLLVYPWERAEAALRAFAGTEPDPYDDFVLEYQNPTTGGPALPTLGMALQWLRPSVHGKAHRHTGSVLYYVVRGEGSSIVHGRRYDWSPGDFVAVPPWAWHEHSNRSDKYEAVLFQVNDLPAMTALDLYREEPYGETGGHQ
ncbi:MAG TPA: cupin domain-containing protein [Stellaceae bacterium]|nr:cupin domain-containing protein [Stellaceae bacterium]